LAAVAEESLPRKLRSNLTSCSAYWWIAVAFFAFCILGRDLASSMGCSGNCSFKGGEIMMWDRGMGAVFRAFRTGSKAKKLGPA